MSAGILVTVFLKIARYTRTVIPEWLGTHSHTPKFEKKNHCCDCSRWESILLYILVSTIDKYRNDRADASIITFVFAPSTIACYHFDYIPVFFICENIRWRRIVEKKDVCVICVLRAEHPVVVQRRIFSFARSLARNDITQYLCSDGGLAKFPFYCSMNQRCIWRRSREQRPCVIGLVESKHTHRHYRRRRHRRRHRRRRRRRHRFRPTAAIIIIIIIIQIRQHPASRDRANNWNHGKAEQNWSKTPR